MWNGHALFVMVKTRDTVEYYPAVEVNGHKMPFTLGRQQYLRYSEKISQNAQDHTDTIFVFKFRTHMGGGQTTGFDMIDNCLNHTEKKLHTHL